MAVFFNGRKWVTPTVMSRVDDSAMAATNLDGNNIAVFIGRSEGGEPKTAITFSSASEAREVLRGGELLTAIEQAFDPSSETTGPSKMVGVRVNPAVQASAEINDADGNAVIRLTSTDYGAYVNKIRFKIESGTEGGKKITTQLGEDYYAEDNVRRDAFNVTYRGEAESVTMAVSNTAITFTVDMQETVLSLESSDTVQEVVDRINSLDGVEAEILDSNGLKPSLNGLDAADSVVLKRTPDEGDEEDTDTGVGTYVVTADLQAVVDWFNGISEGYVNAERIAGAGTVPENADWAFLSGGSDGNVTASDWQDCFDMLQAEDVQWITPLSSEPAVHAMCDTHCAYMSNVGRKERRCIVGGPLNASDRDAIEAAKAYNSDRLSYVHLGMYDYNSEGELALFPPYILAAKIAGMFSGVTPGYSLTNRTIKIKGIERNLRNPTDTDALLEGGVLPVENRDKGFTITQSISTWRGSNKYNRREVSTGTAVDYVCRTVRSRVEDLIGGEPASPEKLKLALETADTALRELSRENIIVGDEESPAFRNLSASIEGDFLRMEVEVSPGIPVNYIGITVHCVPYSGSASI